MNACCPPSFYLAADEGIGTLALKWRQYKGATSWRPGGISSNDRQV